LSPVKVAPAVTQSVMQGVAKSTGCTGVAVDAAGNVYVVEVNGGTAVVRVGPRSPRQPTKSY